MYFTDDGFVISAREITTIIVVIVIFYVGAKILYGKIGGMITEIYGKSEDYPGFEGIYGENRSNVAFADIADRYIENNSNVHIENDSDYNDSDIERRKKVIFEENISGVPFRYNERTRVLTIGNVQNTTPIDVKLGSFDDFRDFVDRLEDYVNE